MSKSGFFPCRLHVGRDSGFSNKIGMVGQSAGNPSITMPRSRLAQIGFFHVMALAEPGLFRDLISLHSKTDLAVNWSFFPLYLGHECSAEYICSMIPKIPKSIAAKWKYTERPRVVEIILVSYGCTNKILSWEGKIG